MLNQHRPTQQLKNRFWTLDPTERTRCAENENKGPDDRRPLGRQAGGQTQKFEKDR